jgi:hypothetical protein
LIEADTMAIAFPLQEDITLQNNLKHAGVEFYAIGDCKQSRLIVDAISDGAIIGNSI